MKDIKLLYIINKFQEYNCTEMFTYCDIYCQRYCRISFFENCMNYCLRQVHLASTLDRNVNHNINQAQEINLVCTCSTTTK